MAKENKKINQSQQNPENKPEKVYNGEEATEQDQEKEQSLDISPTTYDDTFRTLLMDCKSLILSVIKELFGREHVESSVIVPLRDEYDNKNLDENARSRRIIADSVLLLKSKDGTRRFYHLECQSTKDVSMTQRFVEYDLCIARDFADTADEKGKIILKLPHSALINLYSQKDTPKRKNFLEILIEGDDGNCIHHNIRVIFVQDYSRKDILEKRLFFLYPFYLIRYKDSIPVFEADGKLLANFLCEIAQIIQDIEKLTIGGSLTWFEGKTILILLRRMINFLAKDYPKVREGVARLMEGNAVYTEARRILDEGKIIGAIQTMLEDGKSKDEIFVRVSKKYNLEKEKFEELFQKATETED